MFQRALSDARSELAYTAEDGDGGVSTAVRLVMRERMAELTLGLYDEEAQEDDAVPLKGELLQREGDAGATSAIFLFRWQEKTYNDHTEQSRNAEEEVSQRR